MTSALSASEREAARLRLHNEEFRFALAHNISLREAKNRLAQLRMVELEERVHPPLKPGCDALCGTASPALDQPSPDSRRFWWKDHDL